MALVPARGGSRGLPGKNLATVGGQSLVARAVRTAAGVAAIDETVVSSDDAAILAAGVAAGATALRRDAALAGDTTPTLAVVRAFLDLRTDVDVVVLLQPTSPMRTPADVERCLAALESAPAVTTIGPVDHPVEWHFRLRPGGRLEPVFGWDALVPRRQESAPTYVLNGAVYAARADHVRAGGSLVGPDTAAVTMPRDRSVDIDDELDLVIARAIAAATVQHP